MFSHEIINNISLNSLEFYIIKEYGIETIKIHELSHDVDDSIVNKLSFKKKRTNLSYNKSINKNKK